MADLADIASDFVDHELNFRLQKIRNHVKNALGPEICGECDSEIPMGRRQLGYQYCIHCAEEMERHGSLFVES